MRVTALLLASRQTELGCKMGQPRGQVPGSAACLLHAPKHSSRSAKGVNFDPALKSKLNCSRSSTPLSAQDHADSDSSCTATLLSASNGPPPVRRSPASAGSCAEWAVGRQPPEAEVATARPPAAPGCRPPSSALRPRKALHGRGVWRGRHEGALRNSSGQQQHAPRRPATPQLTSTARAHSPGGLTRWSRPPWQSSSACAPRGSPSPGRTAGRGGAGGRRRRHGSRHVTI